MDEYHIEPDGDGYEVTRILPDGKTAFIGRFPSEDNAQHWIESRRESPAPSGQRFATRRWS